MTQYREIRQTVCDLSLLALLLDSIADVVLWRGLLGPQSYSIPENDYFALFLNYSNSRIFPTSINFRTSKFKILFHRDAISGHDNMMVMTFHFLLFPQNGNYV